MVSDKELKKDFKKKASQDPDRYYATGVLKKYGYMRKQCSHCGTFFWTVHEDRGVCGDPACSGGFRLFENNPCKKALSYIDVWREFSQMFERLGYTPIDRYPVVARWNPTADFVIASIAAFQPYVVSGEVEPPAKHLVLPQFSIRFDDIENIGITASHQTGFVMIGQHMFVPPEEWDQDKAFEDIITWLTEGLGLSFSDVTFHEDAWAGGGNFGPCMEYFCRGVELGNQVYMMYEQTPSGSKELDLKVLDMGMGMERNAWFSQVTPTQHQAVYPKVIDYLLERTGFAFDDEFMKRFIPLSAMLNFDEVDDIEEAWKDVADKLDMDAETVKEKVLPASAIFSIADHSRTLLFALCDGALPSNVGGGYNLRILVRRSLEFMDRYGWSLRLADVCRVHAQELEPLFPELLQAMPEVEKILDVEREKYENTKRKMYSVIQRIAASEVTEEKLLELYDSQGISPYMVIEEARRQGKEVHMPSNFFGKVSERHAQQEGAAEEEEEKLPLEGLSETRALYYDDYQHTSFRATVQRIIGTYVVLDQTAFYPTAGGQLHDTGLLGGHQVTEVFKQGPVIVHTLAEEPHFNEKDTIDGMVDFETRRQLAQHHTATHIVNAAARKVLGRHINQAGAKKTQEKAHLDVTHYEVISDEALQTIEDEANRIVEQDAPIELFFMDRAEAERTYGMGIYQGGAVPGKQIRLVKISGIDVEACGGTHLHRTSETGKIRIVKSSKIQDGIVRITFTAGRAAEEVESEQRALVQEAVRLLGAENERQVPARAKELFSKWKHARKAVKKGKELEEDAFTLTSTEEKDGDVLSKTAEVLKTQPEHVINTISRFLRELEGFREQLQQ